MIFATWSIHCVPIKNNILKCLPFSPPHIEKPSFTEHYRMSGSSGQHCCVVLLIFRSHLRHVPQNAYLKISTRAWATSCHLSPWILLRNPKVQYRSYFAQSLNNFLPPLTQYFVVCSEIQHRELHALQTASLKYVLVIIIIYLGLLSRWHTSNWWVLEVGR